MLSEHISLLDGHIFNMCETLLITPVKSSCEFDTDYDIRKPTMLYCTSKPKPKMAIAISLLALCVFPFVYVNASNFESDMSRMLIYYEPRSRLPLRITSIQNSLSNSSLASHQSTTKVSTEVVLRRFGFRSNGCTCQEFTCGCCAGLNFQQFNFIREGCMNFTYNPFEFAIYANMYMNDNVIFSAKLSARNPPPLCIPIPIPYLPTVDFCAKLLDVYTPGQNLHMCLDFETRIQRATVLILHFNCMRMGADGLAFLKPGEGAGGLPLDVSDPQVDVDKFDEVTEIKCNNVNSL